jgi:hypothetical protein
VLLPTDSQAAPILWTLQDVTFDDAGTATGSFVFDTDASTYSLINVATTAGSVISTDATYSEQHPFYLASGDQFLVMVDALPPGAGTRSLQLPFMTGLTSSGGTVILGGLFNFGEGFCSSAPCQDVSIDLPMRRVATGAVVGTPFDIATIPEPATMVLLTTGLALAGARHLRRRHRHATAAHGFGNLRRHRDRSGSVRR